MARNNYNINNIELEDLILGKLANEKDFSKNIILIRLYDEYQKNIKNKTQYDTEITLIDLKNAYIGIINKVHTLSLDDEFYDEYTLQYIKDNILMLKTYFDSFDLSNTKKVKESVNLITVLQCLLKLPVSFPSSLCYCLNKELHKESEIYSYEKRKDRRFNSFIN